MKNTFPKLKLVFRVITLSEPAKKDLIPYLDAERLGKPLPDTPPRLAHVQFYLEKATQFRQARVDLHKQELLCLENLDGTHAYVDAGEMQKCEAACLTDSRVQAAIKALELPEGAKVTCDPWTYSPDGMNDMKRRCVLASLSRNERPKCKG